MSGSPLLVVGAVLNAVARARTAHRAGGEIVRALDGGGPGTPRASRPARPPLRVARGRPRRSASTLRDPSRKDSRAPPGAGRRPHRRSVQAPTRPYRRVRPYIEAFGDTRAGAAR